MKKSPARNVHLKQGPSKLLEKINSSIDVDSRLYNEDIVGSIAHTKMLIKTKIISSSEGKKIIVVGLNQILKDIEKGKVKFLQRYEDIHMNIEALLHNKIGALAGKSHTARSRNDQVVTDFKLWIKKNSLKIDRCKNFQKALIGVAKKNTLTVMPGYTHLQVAQPVSLSHHCLAYVEMIGRDRSRIKDCIKRLNENPLGSGALAGTSFPIDRKMTSKLLGFEQPTANSIDSSIR